MSKPTRRVLITSALPYINNVPHLGNIIGCVLSADVFARFCRSRGYETLYICGADEHGTTTETKALEEGLTPKEICDKYYKIHKDIYDWFRISTDHFGRTSAPIHHEITQAIFKDVHENGFVRQESVEQSYCEKDDKFLADRFIEGTCPHCDAADARGDQCDACGKLLNPLELKNPRCKTCGSAPVVKTSEHLFLDLEKLQPELETWFSRQSKEGKWATNAITVTESWLKEGLKPRAITRDLSWGVSVPLEGFEGKVFYVWFDAPIGYVSITAEHTDDWQSWWNAEDVELYQFMAKDNIPFHSILFPGTEIATRKTWTKVKHLSSTEYLNYETGKFSKSRGIGVFGTDVQQLDFSPDAWRYYLLINRPERADTAFSWEDFIDKLNNELVANLGNFTNRLVTFIGNFTDGKLPRGELSEEDEQFWSDVTQREEKITDLLENVQLKDALKEIMALSKQGNAFFQAHEPWRTIKSDPKRAHATLYVLAHLLRDLAILIEPFLPETAERIAQQLGVDEHQSRWDNLGTFSLQEGQELAKAQTIFTPADPKVLPGLRERFSGTQAERESADSVASPAQNVSLVAAKIIEVDDHPDADRLFVLKIDLGTEQRQLVAGLKGHYEKDELLGKPLIVVANLQPAKLRGVESQGMLLAADDGKTVEVVDPQAPPGTRVNGPAADSEKITFEEFMQVKLSVKDGKALIDGIPLTADGKEILLSRVKDGKIR